MHHSTNNLSLTIGIFPMKGSIEVSANGQSLVGGTARFFIALLYFVNQISVKFIEIPNQRGLTAIRNGQVDLIASSYLLSYSEPSFFDSFNATILPTHNNDICVFIHKALREKEKAVDVSHTINNIFPIQNLYLLCFSLLFLSLWLLKYLTKSVQSRENHENIMNTKLLERFRIMIGSVFTLLGSSFFIWLFNAHFTTESSVSIDSVKLNNIQEIESWPIDKIFHISNSCGWHYIYNIASHLGPNYKAEFSNEFVAIHKLANNPPGPFLMIIPNIDIMLYAWYFCYHHRENCENHYLHSTDPFAEVFKVYPFSKVASQKKKRFLLRYAHSMNENGMWLSVHRREQIVAFKIFGSEVAMRSQKHFKSIWSPISLTFIAVTLWILLVFLVVSGLFLILFGL